MERIDNYEEVQHILSIPIQTKKESRDTADELSYHNWLVIGAMQRTLGVWAYGFRAPSNITMYCEDLDIRRWPTGQELDQILEHNWE